MYFAKVIQSFRFRKKTIVVIVSGVEEFCNFFVLHYLSSPLKMTVLNFL
jgi:hypothetical protein